MGDEHGTVERTAMVLVAGERLLTCAVSAVEDRDGEVWILQLDSAIRHIEEAK